LVGSIVICWFNFIQNDEKLKELLSRAWDELDDESKQVYIDKEAEDRQRFVVKNLDIM
jgi:hypothetical protein